MNLPRIQISGQTGSMHHYISAITAAGAIPCAAYAPAPDLTCDGLILCGGGDIEPTRFKQSNCGSHPPDPLRDTAEFTLVKAFFRTGKPILGICRGMQVLCVAAGGTLIQHLPPEQLLFHLGTDAGDAVHPLRTADGSLLRTLYGETFSVNSWHHQAVAHVGTDFLPIAWSESGFPEAVMHATQPVLGVQFHPERMAWNNRRPDTADGAPVFHWFVRRCAEHIS